MGRFIGFVLIKFAAMKVQKFSLKKRLKSFVYAFSGFKTLLKEEHNSRIHLIAAVCAVALSIVLQISTYEWIAVIVVIGFVFAMELVNTVVENIADYLTDGFDARIKKIKDLSTAATLMSAVVALVVGVVIFLPKIVRIIVAF